MSDEKLMMKPITRNNGQINLPISESELLDGLKAYNAHADEIAELSHKEMDALSCDVSGGLTEVLMRKA